MQVDDVIVIFLFQRLDHFVHILFDEVNFADVRIVLKNPLEGGFCKVMDLRMLQLLPDAAYYRCGEHNVADGAEAYRCPIRR